MNTFVRLALFVCLFVGSSVAASSDTEQKHQYGNHYFYTDATLPDWVSAVKPSKSKGKKSGQGTEYLLVDNQLLADADNYQSFYRSSYILHSSQAVAEGAEVELSFNPAYQTLTMHSISLRRGRETLEVLQPNMVRLLQQEEDLQNGIYDGRVTAIAIVPNVRVGDQLTFSYTLTGRNPVFGEKIFDSFSMGWSVDVGRTQVRVLVPAEKRITTKIHGLDLQPKIKKRGAYTEYVWSAKKVDGQFNEDDYPHAFVRYPWVEFTEYRDWSDVESWAKELYGSVEQAATELPKLADAFASKSDSDEDYLLAALNFTQEDIRYLGMELGQNSHLPHSPDEVLKNRYGDCKDKSNLLVQLLRARGISAYPALVSSSYREGFTAFLPSPAAFDHVIVMARVNQQTVWLDPTKTYQTGGLQDLGFTPYGTALVIGGDTEGSLVDVLSLKGQQSLSSVQEMFRWNAKKERLELSISSEFRGNSAEYQRYSFDTTALDDMQSNYLNYYAKMYPNIHFLKPIAIRDDKLQNRFFVEEHYYIDDPFKVENGLHQLGFYAGTIASHLRKPKHIRRESPAYIGGVQNLQHSIVVDFGGDVGLDIDSTPYRYSSSLVDYQSHNDYFDGRYVFNVSAKIKSSTVSVAELPEFLEFMDTMGDDLDFTLSFIYPYVGSDGKKQLLRSIGGMKND